MMGLFKKNPAEKKLKELTGGFVLKSEFIKRLEKNGLKNQDGHAIQNQLKDEIKQGLSVNRVEIRLNQLINECKKEKTTQTQEKICPKCNSLQEENNAFCINCGYRFNQEKTCPICDTTQEDSNIYCINCGYDFVNKQIEDTNKDCPNCHKRQYIKNKTCSDCGYDFNTKKMPTLVKRCPKCGLVQKSANMFCRSCKQDLRDVDYQPCGELIECSHCGRKIPKNKDMCPFCKTDFNKPKIDEMKKRIAEENKQKEEERLKALEAINFQRKSAFLSNYDFNMKTCPECNTQFLKVDPFCFNCGASVVTNETVKNDNLKVKDGKLVSSIDEQQSNELSELEALYKQTVKSKYAPSFKIGYVLYLDAFSKNPNKDFPEKTAKKYDTTPKKLQKQAIEDEFIELAPAIAEAKKSKVSDLKDILKEHNLKVSGKKDELIQRLYENLTEEALKKYFKSKNYQISEKGLEFLENNSYVLYIYKNTDISSVFYPSEIGKIFEEKKYSQDEIYDILLRYLKNILDDKLTQELWVDFKSYSNAIATILEDKNDLKETLNMRFKVFLFDINNYSVVLERPDPRKTKLRSKDVSKLNNLLHKLTLPIDELKESFETAYDEVLFKMVISKEDALIYLLKVFGGEDLDNISQEINETYSNPY